MEAHMIESLIEQALPCHAVEVEGDGQHWEATVICDDFAGKNTMTRHRMVYRALGDKMGNEIHALVIYAHTLSEWQQLQA